MDGMGGNLPLGMGEEGIGGGGGIVVYNMMDGADDIMSSPGREK